MLNIVLYFFTFNHFIITNVEINEYKNLNKQKQLFLFLIIMRRIIILGEKLPCNLILSRKNHVNES